MKEDFLHFIWKEQLFSSSNLSSEEGNQITILEIGQYNHHAGPDFFNCQLKIDDMIWVGNVEIHIRSSDWYKHQHHQDLAYDNVILHVVLEKDSIVSRSNGTIIPTLVLKDRFYKESYLRYHRFFSSGSLVYPCKPYLKNINPKLIQETLDQNYQSRLKSKTDLINEQLKMNKSDWEETFYHLLAKAFGFKVNAVPLQLLAETIPLKTVNKESDSILKIEALLFGTAGLLNANSPSPYLSKLQTEFRFQQLKYRIGTLHPSIWKFGKLRPTNFPTIRIAQLAMLLYRQKRLFKRCIQATSIEQLEKILSTDVSDYWMHHYHFEKSTAPSTKLLGNESLHTIIANTIIPFCYAYGKHINEEKLIDKAYTWIKELWPEKNKYTKIWEQAGIKFNSMKETQGLLQLHKEIGRAHV